MRTAFHLISDAGAWEQKIKAGGASRPCNSATRAALLYATASRNSRFLAKSCNQMLLRRRLRSLSMLASDPSPSVYLPQTSLVRQVSATYLLRDARCSRRCEHLFLPPRTHPSVGSSPLEPKLVCVCLTHELWPTRSVAHERVGLKIARLRAGARAWSHLSTSAALQIQSDLAIGTRELSRPPRRAVLALCCWRIIPWRWA